MRRLDSGFVTPDLIRGRNDGVLLSRGWVILNNVGQMKDWMRRSNIVWMPGYRYSVDWLAAMLIDLAVFQQMVAFPRQWLHKKTTIFNRITNAVLLFNGNAEIAVDESEKSYLLRDSITLVIQPEGQGQRPQDMSSELSEIWGEGPIPEPLENDLSVIAPLKMLWKKFL